MSKDKKFKLHFRIKNIFLIFALVIFILVAIPTRPARAQIVTTNPISDILKKVGDLATKLWNNAGAIAYHSALSTILNKFAYDTATYIGSGAKGQKPLWITNPGQYFKNAGDAAAGQFVETFVNNMNKPMNTTQDCSTQLRACESECMASFASQQLNTNTLMQTTGAQSSKNSLSSCSDSCKKANTACAAKNQQSLQGTANAMNATPSFNVCHAASITAKLQIGLGLINANEPQAPNCSASKMISNWGTDIKQKIADLNNPNYINTFANLFNPSSNDLGIYYLAKTDMSSKAIASSDNAKTNAKINKGWLNVTGISGNIASPPGTPARTLEEAKAIQDQNFGKVTTDVLVDAANIGINQLAMSFFNKLLRSLGSHNPSSSGPTAALSLNGYTSDPNSGYGATVVKKAATSLLKPKFTSQADYSILSSLAVCLDPKNPAPDNCVIDNQFMQAISKQDTVAKALADGYLHSNWRITNNTSGDAYNSSYSLRDIEILVNYRILPIGWEEAAVQATNPTDPHVATLGDLVSCFDPHDNYTQYSSGFDTNNTTWCQGLIDPNWVLSAPLNYCQKQGYGAQILNTSVMPGTTINGSSTPSKIIITRADNYCADNQSCIKQNPDGSCEAYGYCNGEKRTWQFNTDSCQPVDNTCQFFTDQSGNTVSYLQNTLDYGSCNSGNAGCTQYATSGNYASSTGLVSWSKQPVLYFANHLGSCSASDNGCTELINIQPSQGDNLVMDSNFSADTIGDTSSTNQLNNWPLTNVSQAVITDASQDPGGLSGPVLKLTIPAGAAGGVYSSFSHSLLPDNFQISADQAYTFSADVYLASAPAGTTLAITIGSEGTYQQLTNQAGSWQHVSVTRPANTSYNNPSFSITARNSSAAATIYVKNLKFEIGKKDTGYSPYAATPNGSAKIYEKVLPDYLASACYVNSTGATKDYTLKSNAPAICSSYALKCNQSDAGCNAYTNVNDNYTVTAKINSEDYCSSKCAGYDVYISKATYFNSPVKENLIPKTTTTCSAAAVGCNEFTNLDSLKQGGEQKEYYTSLKQCVKPDQATCSTFYAWQGQANGYQLQAYSLKDNGNQPAVTTDDSTLCNATIYNLPVSDPNYNADCQEFYSASGQISYHLVSHTITCSDNCHTYRMTEKNVDPRLTQDQCVGTDKHWDNTSNSCNVCLDGGIWDSNSSSCLYNAIPGEGQTCSASQNGCREYNGNAGSNVQILSSSDFESSLFNWGSSCSNVSSISVSPVSNNKNGHSLKSQSGICTNASAELDVSGLVNTGSSYTVKFLAAAPSNSQLNIYFLNKDTGQISASFNPVTVTGNGSWSVYQTNLSNLAQVVGNNEKLVIAGSGDVYLDNFVLSSITDRYYLIQGSSQIPNACYYDMDGNYQGPDYNLGCSAYQDQLGNTSYLHGVNQLCSASAVGCRQVIDTNNFSSPFAGYWQGGVATSTCSSSSPDCVSVSGDHAIYAVYNPSKQCAASSAGCGLLGQGQGGQNLTSWSDVYELNNPNKYSQTLCSVSDLGCQAWTGSNGEVSYFKDPGTNVCIYRDSQDPTVSGKHWYKVPVKRCDANNDGAITGSEKTGPTCTNNSDCTSGSCIIDNNDYLCNYSVFKTIGLGGNYVPVPNDSAGLCSAAASGCSEYIDPVTSFNPNIVSNPSYIASQGVYDGWGSMSPGTWSGTAPSNTQQAVILTPYKLYSFSVTSGNSQGVSLRFPSSTPVHVLLGDNTFSASTTVLTAPDATDTSVTFYSMGNNSALLSGGDSARTINIHELSVNYQLQSNIDKKSCNGQVQPDSGCVLFNERTISGSSGPASLSYNSYSTQNKLTSDLSVSPDSCSGASCDANQVVKVTPSRVCSRWLACTSYVKDPVTGDKTCYSYGECNALDSQNGCANFVQTSLATTSNIINQNASGYSILGDYNLSQMQVVGSYVAAYDFEGSGEGLSSCPVGSVNSDHSCLVDSPDTAAAATTYPAQGKAYLEVPGGVSWSTPSIKLNTLKSADYYLSYLVDTTKSSGNRAKIIITPHLAAQDTTGAPLVFYVDANKNWIRVVNKFTLYNVDHFTISFGPDNSASSTGPVFFDNIQISPVLQTGPNSYVAPECRLYPTQGSLSCVDQNTNTIKPGLEGYCLKHDPANSNVCLMWYPLDNIPTPNFSVLGYAGRFPLDYCAEASGNFSLLEKREPFLLKYIETEKYTICGHTYYRHSHSSCDAYDYADNGTEGRCDNDPPENKCPADYFTLVAYNFVRNDPNHLRIICEPKQNLLVNHFQSHGDFANTDGEVPWGACANSNNGDGSRNQYLSYITGYGIYDGFQGSEDTNIDPPLVVYNYDNPPQTESDLALPYATSSNANVFSVACQAFVQAVDSSGGNRAWTGRINNSDISSTPAFFAPYSSNLQDYSQSRSVIPFGAANIAPGNGLLSLNNADMSSGSSVAGRPYGCNNGQSDGCSTIGYCSQAPDTYCLTTKNLGSFNSTSTYSLADHTCGQNGGTCLPLWSNSNQLLVTDNTTSPSFEKILKNIFLSGQIYKYNADSYTASNSYDFSNTSGSSSAIPRCSNNTRSNPNAFCAVYPSLSNVKFYYNNSQEEVTSSPITSDTSLSVVKGWYRLEFNTKVDVEQQPLANIKIDWGDGYVQTVTNQDNHPATSSPHIFYHNYRQNYTNGNTIHLKITITDNWGFYAGN